MNLSLDTLNLIIEFDPACNTLLSLMLTCRDLYNMIRNDNYTWYIMYKDMKKYVRSKVHHEKQSPECIRSKYMLYSKNSVSWLMRDIYHWFTENNMDSGYSDYIDMNLQYLDDKWVYDDKFARVLQLYLENNKCKNTNHFYGCSEQYSKKKDYRSKVQKMKITKLRHIVWSNRDENEMISINNKIEDLKRRNEELRKKYKLSLIGEHYRNLH